MKRIATHDNIDPVIIDKADELVRLRIGDPHPGRETRYALMDPSTAIKIALALIQQAEVIRDDIEEREAQTMIDKWKLNTSSEV